MSTTTRPHIYQTAGTLLQGLLAHPNNKVPLDKVWQEQAADWAASLAKMCHNDTHLMLVAARAICALMLNAQSSHCSKDELLTYGVQVAVGLHHAVHGPVAAAPLTNPADAIQNTPEPTAAQ